jgi:hypothetical protein
VVVCIALDDEIVGSASEGVPAHPYIVWGIELHGSPSQIQVQESYPGSFLLFRLVLLTYE